jgi:hypothetical protein
VELFDIVYLFGFVGAAVALPLQACQVVD